MSGLTHEVRQLGQSARGRLSLRPLQAWLRGRGTRRISPALAAAIGPGGTYLPATAGGWSDGGTVIRLPGAIDAYEMPVSPEAVAIAGRTGLGLRMVLEATGFRTVRAGNEAINVLDAEVSAFQLLGADGKPLP